ncbi:hypothetical protein DV451_001455 [Geotrichum candidum]|uniref:Similar to Saccharomyces cerevisiae YFR011C AIM13 Mitochondrial protein peripheral to the inner membrane n=1 Tax=Geotrichum candidum TaxID=1173061 RepID=A0A0J9X974_GEOCN|nr:hypothetical protein DV451_001455 [Geotrichum candidum]KAI9210910.1 hypothetical protein DS838_004213 [Geotrichum bryndzae]KAF5109531.1 hypothetical protein DV453_001450 [Geotrichum candidum]KAF5115366.1 hypothetical protein DV452_003017 [Geotrichum candidum]KAF5116899.1 hypothetical protein DV454_001427 [Geotrichum candidum]
MGAQQSKESQVFLPATPTEFSASLINKLDSSVESDYTRSQYTEKHIQDLVTEKLKEIEKQSSLALKDAFTKLPQPDANDNESHAKDVKQKLDEIKEKLQSRPKRGQLDEETTNARNKVVECLKANDGKPLKCWDEVEAFKARVKAVEDAVAF